MRQGRSAKRRVTKCRGGMQGEEGRRGLKFGLNSKFVYMFVENLKQFASDVCTVGRVEGHSTHATRREAVYQQCNQPGRQAMSIVLYCVD